MIPEFLFRGDSDSRQERKLRSVYPGSFHGFLLTNLSNEGSGREIFTAPLVAAVNRHISMGWPKTHFLSFSASRDRAIAFAAGPERHCLVPTEAERWNSAVITLDTARFTASLEVEPGIHQCTYPGRIALLPGNGWTADRIARFVANAPEHGRPIRILLIDVASYLGHQISAGHADLGDALAKATRDCEWLILPIDPCNGAPGEFTAALDDGCISVFERFTFGIGGQREN